MSSVVSVGLFNHVFVFSKDDILDEMGRATSLRSASLSLQKRGTSPNTFGRLFKLLT